MIARTKDKLVEAATGVPAPAPTPATASPMGMAMASKVSPRKGFEDFLTTTGLITPGLSNEGLSSKGRYSGFNTSTELERAITGEALMANEEANRWASDLKALATARAGQARQAQGQEWQMRAPKAYEPQMGPMSPQATQKEEAARLGTLYKGLSEAQQLSNEFAPFYGELAQSRQTAEDVENIPASQYARALATRKYGMNPALAAGTFGTDFDIEVAQDLRDQYYYETGQGLGYQDYVSRLAREQSQADREEQAFRQSVADAVKSQDPQALYDVMDYSQEARDLYYNQLVSQELGMDAARLFRAAQVTPEQGYNLTQARVPIGEDGATANFAELADQAAQQIANDDEAGAFATANQLIFSEDEGTRMLGRLLATYVDNLARAAGKTGRGLYQYQQASDILGP